MMNGPRRIDWPALAGFAMVRFGWSADQFWAATPLEFKCALDALMPRQSHGHAAILKGSELAALMLRFPDY